MGGIILGLFALFVLSLVFIQQVATLFVLASFLVFAVALFETCVLFIAHKMKQQTQKNAVGDYSVIYSSIGYNTSVHKQEVLKVYCISLLLFLLAGFLIFSNWLFTRVLECIQYITA